MIKQCCDCRTAGKSPSL